MIKDLFDLLSTIKDSVFNNNLMSEITQLKILFSYLNTIS